MSMKFLLTAGAALLAASLAASPAGAQTKELATATQHAGLAAKANDLKTVQQHLHHVINCLVGPSGAGFDASFGNPCNGQGSGAIPGMSNMAKRKSLESALGQARDGAQQSNLSIAQHDAMMAQNTMMGKSMASAKRRAPAKMNHPM